MNNRVVNSRYIVRYQDMNNDKFKQSSHNSDNIEKVKKEAEDFAYEMQYKVISIKKGYKSEGREGIGNPKNYK